MSELEKILNFVQEGSKAIEAALATGSKFTCMECGPKQFGSNAAILSFHGKPMFGSHKCNFCGKDAICVVAIAATESTSSLFDKPLEVVEPTMESDPLAEKPYCRDI